MQVPQPPELIHLIIPLILLPPPNAESLNELAKVENADRVAIMSVQFHPDGKTIVSGGYSGMLKVWDAGASMPPCPSACQTDPYQSSLHSLSRVEGDEG